MLAVSTAGPGTTLCASLESNMYANYQITSFDAILGLPLEHLKEKATLQRILKRNDRVGRGRREFLLQPCQARPWKLQHFSEAKEESCEHS